MLEFIFDFTNIIKGIFGKKVKLRLKVSFFKFYGICIWCYLRIEFILYMLFMKDNGVLILIIYKL